MRPACLVTVIVALAGGIVMAVVTLVAIVTLACIVSVGRVISIAMLLCRGLFVVGGGGEAIGMLWSKVIVLFAHVKGIKTCAMIGRI